MDIASLGGMVLGVVMIVFGIISSGGVVALGNFVDVPSLIITVGGSVAGVLMSRALTDTIGGLKSLTLIFKAMPNDPSDTIKNIINLSNVARKEGLLALEEAAGDLEDQFLKKGILLVVDGTDPELVRGILETDLVCMEGRHKKVHGFWEKWGELGPAWGMIGTLIGLVNMLKNLSDMSTIGPNMAVALLTTLYGSIIANWLCSPTAEKLKANSGIEVSLKEITIEGLLSIQAGENPRVIEEKLKSFMSPELRAGLESEGGDEGGGE